MGYLQLGLVPAALLSPPTDRGGVPHRRRPWPRRAGDGDIADDLGCAHSTVEGSPREAETRIVSGLID